MRRGFRRRRRARGRSRSSAAVAGSGRRSRRRSGASSGAPPTGAPSTIPSEPAEPVRFVTYQPIATRKAESPANETVWPPQSRRKSRLLKAESALARSESSIGSRLSSRPCRIGRWKPCSSTSTSRSCGPGRTSAPRATCGSASGTGSASTSRATTRRGSAPSPSSKRHPELEHDDEVWIVFTERIIRGMGGDAAGAYACAAEMVAAWEHARQLRALRRRAAGARRAARPRAEARARLEHEPRPRGVRRPPRARRRRRDRLALVRQDEARPGRSSARRSTGSASAAGAAVMVGDSVEDDIEGALALGMRAILLDREGRYPELEPPDRGTRRAGCGATALSRTPRLPPRASPPGRRRPPRRRRARATRRAGASRAARRARGSSGSNARPVHSSWPSSSQRRCQKRGSSAATVRKRPSAVA